jgi:8-oxo-dGTP diphosphatase
VEPVPTFGEQIDGVEYVSRPGGYAVINDGNGRIAVVRTPKGIFLPGGAVEAGETSRDAAIRETMEETGLAISITAALGRADELVYKRSAQRYFRKECDFYAAQVIAGKGESCEPDHTLEWIPATEIGAALTHQSQKWAVARARADTTT